MIESYTFGKMQIEGREYTKDLVILPDGAVLDHWWRKSGHVLSVGDLVTVIDSSPSLLIVGTGSPGLMRPDASLLDDLQSREITAKVMPTAEAVTEFNLLAARGGACAGCFHLTC